MKKFISWVLCLTLLLFPAQQAFAANDVSYERIAGSDRYLTSVEISKHSFQSADTVVIASGVGFADALTGGVLAAAVKGPVLLTAKDHLPDSVKEELQRLKPTQIYLLGGDNSISNAVEFELYTYATVERIQGNTRYETANRIREKILELNPDYHKTQSGYVSGLQFADALPAAAYAAHKKVPLLLTDGVSTIDGSDTVFGGATTIPKYSGKMRIAGSNRFSSSVEAANASFGKNPKAVVLVSGRSFPDALSAISLSVAHDAPILLVEKDTIPKEIATYLDQNTALEKILVVGGENTISRKIDRQYVQVPFPPVPEDLRPLNKFSNARKGWAYAHNDASLDALIRKHNAHSRFPEIGKKLILTFDCGYSLSDYTSRILDTLKEKKVQATFFLAGAFIDSEPKTTIRMTEEGHVVGNHTVDHKLAPDTIHTYGVQTIIDDIKGLEKKYKAVTGLELSPVIRPPEGLWSEKSLALYKMLGYETYFWDLAYLDWDIHNQPSESFALATLKEKTRPGAVILLHTISKTNTKILGEYIDWAKSQGYEFISPLDIEK